MVVLFEIDLHQLTIKVIRDDKIQVSLGVWEERRGGKGRGGEGRGGEEEAEERL